MFQNETVAIIDSGGLEARPPGKRSSWADGDGLGPAWRTEHAEPSGAAGREVTSQVAAIGNKTTTKASDDKESIRLGGRAPIWPGSAIRR